MEKKKGNRSWGTVFSAVVLSLLVVGLLVFAFFQWVMPYFSISKDQVFSFSLKLLPFIIGIILIIVGVSLKVRKQSEFDEALREKIRNDNLFALPVEEPSDAEPKTSTLTDSELQEVADAASVPQENLEKPDASEESPIDFFDKELGKQLEELAREDEPETPPSVAIPVPKPEKTEIPVVPDEPEPETIRIETPVEVKDAFDFFETFDMEEVPASEPETAEEGSEPEIAEEETEEESEPEIPEEETEEESEPEIPEEESEEESEPEVAEEETEEESEPEVAEEETEEGSEPEIAEEETEEESEPEIPEEESEEESEPEVAEEETEEESVPEVAEEETEEESEPEVAEEETEEESEPVAEQEEDEFSNYVSIIDSNDPAIKLIDSVELSEDDVIPHSKIASYSLDSEEGVLAAEIDSANRIDYDVCFLSFSYDSYEKAAAILGESAQILISDGKVLAVVPFYNESELRKTLADADFDYKLFSRKNKKIELSEVQSALA